MNHRASLGQWQTIKKCSKLSTQSCILELRDRIEALEAAASTEPSPSEVAAAGMQDKPNHSAKPDSSLVERVAAAISGDTDGLIDLKPEARAAIREVAAWLSEQERHVLDWAAVTLEGEAEHR